MKYYEVIVTGDLAQRDLCIVEDPPEGMGLEHYFIARGRKAAPFFPADAKVFLRKERRGIKLGGLLGNLNGYFIGNGEVKKIIQEHSKGQEIEFLPFTLYNQKKRAHSQDYCFINPIGTFDCLDEKASGAKFDKDGDIITTTDLVLDKKKLAKAPDFFRIGKLPTKYVMSFTLAKALQDAGVTNVVGYEIEVK